MECYIKVVKDPTGEILCLKNTEEHGTEEKLRKKDYIIIKYFFIMFLPMELGHTLQEIVVNK